MGKYKKQLQKTKWYHGTTLNGWNQLCQHKIQVKYNIGNELDFGHGFYVTQQQQQAEKYINDILKFKNAEMEKISSIVGLDIEIDPKDEVAVVIEFDINPMEWYDCGEYNFRILDKYNDEFAEFVFHNRLLNVEGEDHHKYDLIYGVMSDSLPMILIPQYRNDQISYEEVIEGLKKSTRDTQLSIHNQNLCDKMVVTKAYFVETREELSVNDYNERKGSEQLKK